MGEKIETIRQVSVEKLHLNPDNIRDKKVDYDPEDPSMKSLVEDIRINGILQPLVILEDGMVLFGNRRLTAAKFLGLKTVPCLTRKLDSEEEKIFFQMSENMCRKFPLAMRRGEAYSKLMKDYQLSKEQIRKRTGDLAVDECVKEWENYLKTEKKVGLKRAQTALKALNKRTDGSTVGRGIFKRNKISEEDKITLTEVICQKNHTACTAESVAQQLQNDTKKSHTREEIEDLVNVAGKFDEHNILVYNEDWQYFQSLWKTMYGELERGATFRHYMAEIVRKARNSNIH